MKKYHFIALAVCCGFLWACQKDGPTENPYADAPWAIDETLPVPIQVTTQTTETKANAILSLDGVNLQVLAYDTSRGDSSLMYEQEFAATSSGDALSFTDGPLYYPFEDASAEEDRINYSFFAYHAPGASGTFNGMDYNLSFPFDPVENNNDILAAADEADDYQLQATYGRYEAGTTYSGFNGRYARVTRLDGHLHSPALNFKHCAARIILNAKADPDDATAASSFIGSGLRLRLTSITLPGAHANAKLNLTDALTGTPAMTWDSGSDEVTNGLFEMPLSAAPWTVPTAGGAVMHHDNSLFIVPGNYQIRVNCQRAHFASPEDALAGDASDDEEDLPTLNLTTPPGGYLAGYTYTYNVIVLSESVVTISTSLTGWDDGAIYNEYNNQN